MGIKYAAFLILLHTFTIPMDSEKRVILCAFYTPSHEQLAKEWFLPSIQDDFELMIGTGPQECADGYWFAENWTKTTAKKVLHIINTTKQNIGRIMIFSDVDIQFFQPIQEDLLALLKTYDIVVQKDGPQGQICSGFFIQQCNDKVVRLWEAVYKLMEKNHPTICDQRALTRILRNSTSIKWSYLPARYLSGGTLTGKRWDPGDILPIPDNIMIHHANWTLGIPNKIKQLEYVRAVVEKRKTLMAYTP